MQATTITEEPLVHEMTSTEVEGFFFGSSPADVHLACASCRPKRRQAAALHTALAFSCCGVARRARIVN